MNDLKKVEEHFAFGENWSRYAELIDEEKIQEAKKGLTRLLTSEQLEGKSFLDIGCGSGLHSLAALRLGVQKVYATDIDHDSVVTTKKVLQQFALGSPFIVEEVSVFDLPEKSSETFDVVYSWGVLHHTGAMDQAIKAAAKLVKSDGLLVLALYRKTPMCRVWKVIKRWYTHTSSANQQRARNIYIALLKVRYWILRKDFNQMKDTYVSSRGMSFEHDVHDWMGGYPYESITPKQMSVLMEKIGFTEVKRNIHKPGFGLFGSGCDEYVFQNQRQSVWI